MTISVLHACDYNDRSKEGDYFKITREKTWLTKRIDKLGNKHRANYPKKFKLGEFYNPDSLIELKPILKTLGNDPKALIIRHKYINPTIGDVVFRQAKFVKNEASKIICMDIDELELPLNIDRKDIAAQGLYVCDILHKCVPNIFPDDMGFIAQGSSSAGLSNIIKLHLWLENYDCVDQSQLKNLFYNVNSTFKAKFETKINLVDISLYNDIQAHYTAYPLFEENLSDPLKGKRTRYSYGNRCYVPQDYVSYVKPAVTTDAERATYLNAIVGSTIKSTELENRLNGLKDWSSTMSGLRTAVISTYHTAVQGQYCLDLLRREMAEILHDKRPGELDNYVAQGIASAVSNVKACSVREVPSTCLGLPIPTISGGSDIKFLNMERHPPEDSVTFLKATLGTGKTYNIEQWLKNGHIEGNFLALTDTSALVESNTKRFSPARDFRNPKGRLDFVTGKVQRLSGTLHSLYKIKDLTTSFDFLFIDEADSLMNNLLFATIISEEKRAVIIEVLRELLQNTNRVVISDGDISEETVSQYVQLMQGSRELYRVEHKRQNLKGVRAYKHVKESSLWGSLQGHLELGDKCLLVSDSSPKVINEYLASFNRLMPSKIIKVVHSASTDDVDIRDIIDNTTVALRRQEVDALLCSPSITNGVDFNYFDVVFILTTSENHTPNMRFQAMMRERSPEVIHYYFGLMRQFSTGFSGITTDKDFLPIARKAYAARREREYKTYVATFNYYLVESGATVEVIDVPYDNPQEKIDKEEYLIERTMAILNCREGETPPRHNDAYIMQEKIKFFYEVENLSWDDVTCFLTEKPDKCAEYFHKLYKDFGNDILSANAEILLVSLLKKPSQFYLAVGESLYGITGIKGINKAKQILSRCGVKKNALNLIEWYKKYCEYTDGVSTPLDFLPSKETINELL
jgi:hypothetical protein